MVLSIIRLLQLEILYYQQAFLICNPGKFAIIALPFTYCIKFERDINT